MKHPTPFQTGLSLVELMVAITIGLIVSGAVATIFIQSKASYSQNDEMNFLQDNGRYVLNVLAHDLEHAGFFGGTIAGVVYETDPQVDDYLIGGGNFECGPATMMVNGVASWTYDVRTPLNYHFAPTETTVGTNYPCVAGYQVGSDFLTLKRVRGNPITSTASLEPHKVYLYLRNDQEEGVFHTNAVALPANTSAWEYFVHLYYIKDNTLKKMYLGWDDANNRFAMYETDLAEGIEKFHIVFGVSRAGFTTVDYYTSNPTAAQLAAAVTARVYVLARGSKEMQGYTNDKSYRLGDITINYNTESDKYYRRVFSTSVVLRNTIHTNKHSNF